jgi:hypothetical protein
VNYTRPILFVAFSSLIFTFTDFLSLTLFLILCFFNHFESSLVCVPSEHFILCIYYYLIFYFFLNTYPRANRPPTLTCDSSRVTTRLSFMYYFECRLHRAACALFSVHLSCVDCLFYVEYLISTAPGTYTLLPLFLLRDARQLVVIIQLQSTPIY